MVNKKNAFWQALLCAIIIFVIGLLIGVWLEKNEATEIEKILLESDINLLDSQLIGEVIYENKEIKCEIAEEEILKFADKIYFEAKELEKIDESSQLTGDLLTTIHKKYDLLRLILLLESTKIKERCEESFNIVVYIYQYKNPEIKIKSQQTAFSRYLIDLKEKYGSDIILIPIAGDLNLNSIDILKGSYKMDSYPTIIINNQHSINNIENLKELEKLLK